jgi:signal transduction histidine kinase
VEHESELTFPDAPRGALDRSIARLLEDAQQVLATQDRLRSLLSANRAVADEIELEVVLRRIIEAAVALVGARYGAIGVIAPDGTLEQFIHTGIPEEHAARIGNLPQGRGLLGALIEEQRPIRLDHLASDPRSAGIPAGHPPMDSFLGVPVRVRGETYGNLYLTQQENGRFSAEDEELVIALATTAGAAIDHARLFDESRRRQRWTAASAEVTATLLSDQAEDSLAVLADKVAVLAEADLVCIVVPAGDHQLRVEVARGELAESVAGLVIPLSQSLVGRAHESRQPVLAETAADDDPLSFGATMAVPLTPSDEPSGVLVLSRGPGRPRFTLADLDMAADFAAQASVALQLAAGRLDRQRLALLEDRGRIARDLHDHVIQRLFGAGLSLQAVGAKVDADARARILDQVDALDAAIAEIRTAIFTMTAQPDADRPALRHRVIDILGETSGLFPTPPRLAFSGPVDLMVPDDMADDLVAVVREGLANVARHAGASTVAISVAVGDGEVVVEVIDDGCGIDPAVTRSSGTANLAARAQRWGGAFVVEPGEPSGTVLRWTALLAGTESA